MMVLLIAVMYWPVTFNHQRCLATKEVGYILTELMLSPELEPVQSTISQMLPKSIFGHCLRRSELAGEFRFARGLISTSVMTLFAHGGENN
jgi:hypothetical protein